MLSPIHATTSSAANPCDGGPVLHALEARILVALSRRLTEHQVRLDPNRLEVGPRRVAERHRPIGDDDHPSAERVDALRKLGRAGNRRRGPLVHPRRPTRLGVSAVDRARGAADTPSCRAPSRRRRESRPTIAAPRRASSQEGDRRRVDTSAAPARGTRPKTGTSERRWVVGATRRRTPGPARVSAMTRRSSSRTLRQQSMQRQATIVDIAFITPLWA